MSNEFYVRGDPEEEPKQSPDMTRIKNIPNYPPASYPLPSGIDHAEVIGRYPNHLHGKLLLQISQFWSPKEIQEACPAKEINRRMISTRVMYAKQKFQPDYKPRKYARVGKPQSHANGKTKSKGMGRAEALAAALEDPKGG